jgi:hypothetical protein
MSKETVGRAKNYHVIAQHDGTYSVEIADGSGVVKKKRFSNKAAADYWIAAQKPASGDVRFQPLAPRPRPPTAAARQL